MDGEADALGRAGGDVVVAVTAQDRDPPLGEKFQRGRMQAGPMPGGIPWAELVAPGPVPDPHEQQVARADPHVLRALGCD